MPVVPLTLTISLALVFSFVVFFLREHARGRVSSSERDSLLPLAEEDPRLAGLTGAVLPAPAADEDHDHGDDCGCRDGSRPACPGCLRRH
jgi:hypothetical protein